VPVKRSGMWIGNAMARDGWRWIVGPDDGTAAAAKQYMVNSRSKRGGVLHSHDEHKL
jgi:hypothetical protein